MSRGISINNSCSHGPTTMQQQAHNITPAGFIKFQTRTQFTSKLKLELIKILQEIGKSNKFQIQLFDREKGSFIDTNHSTRH